jgi:hypothetical protein
MKVGISDPQKTTIARQRQGKHFRGNEFHATREKLLEAVVSMRPVPQLYKENQLELFFSVENVRELPASEDRNR